MTTKTARLDFRLPEADKQLLESAAAMSGQSITDFALSALRARAAEVKERYERTKLTDEDRALFLAIVDNSEPSESLERAAAKYKADIRKGGPSVVDISAGIAPR